MITQPAFLPFTAENVRQVTSVEFRDDMCISLHCPLLQDGSTRLEVGLAGEDARRHIRTEEEAYRFIAELLLAMEFSGDTQFETVAWEEAPNWGRRRLKEIRGPGFLEFSLPAEHAWLPAYLADVMGLVQHCSGQRFTRHQAQPCGGILFIAE